MCYSTGARDANYVLMHEEVRSGLVQDMDEDSQTVVRCATGVTDRFEVGVGLAVSSLLFG